MTKGENKMNVFIKKPSVELFCGIKVSRETKLDYKNENVEQSLENLVFHSKTRVKGEGFESIYDTTINLAEGDVLIFEEDGRGYIKPVEAFYTIKEAIEELENIKDIGDRDV